MLEHQIELVMPAGHTLSVHTYGNGQPLVLLHGFPLDASIWQPCCASLTAAGYQVIAPNLRGFGASMDKNEKEAGLSFSLADLADDIEQLRRVLIGHEKYVLGGLSLGGYVAFEVWKRHGEHLRALILSNTKPQADSDEARQGRLAMAEKALKQSTWEAVSPMLSKLLSERTRAQDEQTTNRVKSMMSAVPASTVAAVQRAMAARHDFTNELTQIRVPTLVVTGEFDPISPPADNRQWAARIPKHHLEIISGAAHLPKVEATECLCEVMLGFLKSV